jgi:hypothetical protein
MRRIAAFVLVTALAIASGNWWAPPRAGAASPPGGTVSDAATQVTWTGSTLATAPAFSPGTCQAAQNCDVFNLTINVSSAYRTTNPGFVVFIRIDWQNAANDYDLFIRKDGAAVDESAQGFTTFEEVMLRQPANGTYQVFTHSFATAPATPYSGKASLQPTAPPLVVRTGTYQRDPDGKFGVQMFQFTSDLRLIGANNGQTGRNVEPEIAINPFGTIYVAAIQGVPAGTDAWRSRDGGESFQYLGQPDGTQRAQAGARGAGGGDTDVSLGAPFVLLDVPGVGKVTSTGRLYVSSLWLGSSTISTSIDEGDLFAVSELPVPIHDRQWNASAGTSRVWATARQLGALIVGTTSIFVVQSDDGGLTYPRGAFVTLLFTDQEKERLQGPMIAHPAPGRGDPPNSAVFNVYSGRARDELFLVKCPAPCNLPPLVLDAQNRILPTTPRPFEVRRIFKAPPGMSVDNVFPVVAVDSAGGLHVAFSDKRRIFLMSSQDGGQTWLNPVQVNNPGDAETATALFPWIFTGDSGRVGVMWYGTDRTGDADSEAQFTGAEWKLFYALTPNAFAASPNFQYVVASGMTSGTDAQRRGVVHIGSICTRGLSCNLDTPPGNRNLAEYSSLTGDLLGLANIVVAADIATPNGQARTHFTKQTGGPTGLSRPIVTGGGYIGLDASEKHFGFNVQGDPAGPWSGHLTFLDKPANLLLKATAYSSVRVEGNRVTFSGTGSLQRGSTTSTVTFTVIATDNGEPGVGNDAFSITLPGYSASGVLSGGNIKVY